MAVAAGTRFGPYEIVSALGAGGMGEVYKARDTRLDRIVALKVLAAGVAADPTSRERFEREARAVSSLNHPNICVLHDVGREPPRPSVDDAVAVDFLVMEYLEGETLAARLARGPARVDEALGIAIQIASALDRAHRQGIVHRDLKPGNVMLTKAARSGSPTAGGPASGAHVKLLDFGLARLTRADTEKNGLSHGMVSLADLSMPTMSSPLTMKGTILGTLQYMSPEQLEGKDIDARADIFAFGAVLYEMLTGRRPFEGKSQASLIGAILDHDPPRATSFQPAIPPLLDELVTRCLAKDPDERWQSSRDLMRQLEWIAAQSGAAVAASPQSQSQERRSMRARVLQMSAAVLGAAAIGGGIAAWLLWPKSMPSPHVSRFAIELPEGQGFTRAGRRVLALSPDGARLVYVANQQLYLRKLNELAAVPISGTAGSDPSEPTFSPDGEWVAFWSNNGLKKVPTAGGPPVTLSAADNPNGVSWVGDRILLGQTSPPGIVEVPANGGSPKRLVAVDQTKQELAQSPQLLAGGRAVLFTLRSGNQAWDDSSIVIQDLTSGQRTVLVNGGTDGHVLPTGHLVYARESTLLAMPFDASNLTVSGSAVPIQQDVQLANGGFSGAAQVTWSDAGSLAFTSTGLLNRALVWLDRQGRSERVPLPNRKYQVGSSQMRVSPDGTRVAFTILNEMSSGQSRAGQDIWVWEIARGTLTRLTFTSRSASPVWTPDSKRICNASDLELICHAADGSGRPEPLFKVQGPFTFSALGPVSPDGHWMLLGRRDDKTGFDIMMAAIGSSGEMQPLIQTPGADDSPAISPDGRWLAFVSSESGRDEVFVRPFPNVDRGRWQISSEGAGAPAWARNGRELFYLLDSSAGVSTPLALMSVSVQSDPNFISGRPTTVLKVPAGAGRGFAVGPDGRFLFNVPAASTDSGQTARVQIVVVQNWFEELKARVPTTASR